MIYLYETIEDIKQKYYADIPDDIFMKLIELDPEYRGGNSLGKNGRWILNLYQNGELSEEDYDTIPEILSLFKQYKNRIPNKDLLTYKTVKALEDEVFSVLDDYSMLSQRQRLRFAKNLQSGKIHTKAEDDYDVAYEDNEWVVYIPNTHEASMKLGKDTEWCTARPSSDHYDQYNDMEHQLYIIVDKRDGDKYQFSDKTYEFRDSNDDEFDAGEFEGYASEGLMDYLYGIGFENANGEQEPEEEDIEIDGWNIHIEGDNYKLVNYEGDFDDIEGIDVELPDCVTEIGVAAFSRFPDCNIIIPSGVWRIHDNAFQIADITEITIPDTVRSYGSRLFVDCANLETVRLSRNFTSIQVGTFIRCTSLKRVEINAKIGFIAERAFEECDSLKNLEFSGVMTVGREAFNDCDNLESVTLSDCDEIALRANAFSGCPNLEEISILGSVRPDESSRFISPDMKQPIKIWVDSESRDGVIQIIKDNRMTNLDLTVLQSETGEIVYMTADDR